MEEFSAKIYKVFTDTDTVSSFQAADIILLYEMPFEISQPKYRPPSSKSAEEEGKHFVTVAHVKSGNHVRSDIGFGHPFVVGFTPEEVCSVEAIERKICNILAAYQRVGRRIWSSEGAIGDGLQSSVEDASAAAKSARQIVRDDEDEEIPSPPKVPQHSLQPNAEWIHITVSSPSASLNRESFCGAPQASRIKLAERHQLMLADKAQTQQQTTKLEEDPDNLYGDDAPAQSATDVQPVATEPGLFPLLKNGEIVAIEWSPAAFTEVFEDEQETKPKSEHWSPTEVLVDPAVAERKRQASSDGKPPMPSVDDLLDEFVKEEKLTEDNTWYCPACKKHQQAQKKFDLWKMPDVLVIHLKRFSNERAFRDKIDVLIDFPIEGLDLSSRVEGQKVAKRLRSQEGLSAESSTADDDESLIYDLFAVDNHYGGRECMHSARSAQSAKSDLPFLLSRRRSLHCVCKEHQ